MFSVFVYPTLARKASTFRTKMLILVKIVAASTLETLSVSVFSARRTEASGHLYSVAILQIECQKARAEGFYLSRSTFFYWFSSFTYSS
jgi:hypothetical protein